MDQQQRDELLNGLDERTRNYVLQLESRVMFLEVHHRKCHLQSSEAAVLQSPPSSPTEIREEPIFIEVSFQSQAHILSPDSQTQTLRQRSGNARWKQEADSMLKEVPTAQLWTKWWENGSFQFSSSTPRAIASDIDLVLGQALMPNGREKETSLARTCHSDHHLSLKEDLCLRIGRYAGVVKSLGAAAKLSSQKAAFQEVVFVSLCVLLLDAGIPEDRIDHMMRLGSNTVQNWKTLKNLRRGAVWANKLVNHLSWKGWGCRASLLLLLCKYHSFLCEVLRTDKFRGQKCCAVRSLR
jgi:hypothetical protein